MHSYAFVSGLWGNLVCAYLPVAKDTADSTTCDSFIEKGRVIKAHRQDNKAACKGRALCFAIPCNTQGKGRGT